MSIRMLRPGYAVRCKIPDDSAKSIKLESGYNNQVIQLASVLVSTVGMRCVRNSR